MNLRAEIVHAAHALYSGKMVAAYDGNISALTPHNTVLITPSGVCKGELTEEDIIEISLEGDRLKGSRKPSSESALHLHIYKNRQDVMSVVHAHPVCASAFACTEVSLDRPVFPEVILSLGRIPLCHYGAPSTTDLPASLHPHIQYADVFLLQNHGAVTVGGTVKQAYYRMEKLEHTAQVMLHAYQLGNIRELSKTELEKLYELAETSYGITIKPENRYHT